MKKRIHLWGLSLLFFQLGLAQTYNDYLGAGHSAGIQVTSSSDFQKHNWYEFASGDKTISGEGLDARLLETSRFLAQATLGANMEMIEEVSKMEFEDWIEQQFDAPVMSFSDAMFDVYDEIFNLFLSQGGDPNDFGCRPNYYRNNYAWWQINMTNEDLLRKRIALALSEILVISKENSDIRDYGFSVASFYDIFIHHAFGNYQDILREVSLHPAMGNYLSHLNNPKSNPAEKIFPDENYARELMQLFSIGLFQLNQDGSRKTDAQGDAIPTYDADDIKGLAKVFTGLGGGDTSECGGSVFEPAFGLSIRNIDMTIPMVMYEEFHEPGEKEILNDIVIPTGQTGMEDIEMALTAIFNHDNVGPYIGRLLIQSLVKSNPTPAYISRVAAAFNDNGSGVRGDMKAVVKAILLDEEARSCAAMQDPSHGKMKSPILRFIQYARAMDTECPSGRYWETGNNYRNATNQHPLHSPTVFNFYSPDFQPSGPLADANLNGPEFEIHDSRSSVDYLNQVENFTVDERVLSNSESAYLSYVDRGVYLDLLQLYYYAQDTDVLMNKLDIILTHGQMSDRTRRYVTSIIDEYNSGTIRLHSRSRLALYALLISPEFIILK